MTAFVTLLKREWLEAKVPFFWVQVGLLAFIILISTLVLTFSGFNDLQSLINTNEGGTTALSIDRWTDGELAQYLMMARSVISAPFLAFYSIATIFVLLGALHDDRKDRSVLFWKSMPVNDYETVGSKLVLAVWIAPLIAIAAVVIIQIFFLIVVSGYVLIEDLGSVGRLWWQSGILTGAFQLVLGFLIQGFWTLPIWAWLLFVSALVPRLPLMWAILIPLVPIVAEVILFRTSVISQSIAKHAEAAAIPNLSGANDRIMPLVQTVSDQLALLATADFWLGVLLGLALLYGAVRLRELKNEI